MALLCEKYSKVVDRDEAMVEWDGFKHKMKSYSKCSTLEFLVSFVSESSSIQLYPNLFILAQIFMVFPASSVECERGFSVQNLIKTKIRNRLGPFHLDMLLRIQLLGQPTEKFPFERAYRMWLHAKRRRTKSRSTVSESDESSFNSDSETSDIDT